MKLAYKLLRVRMRRNFRLHNQPFAWKLGQHLSQLALRRSITAGRLDVGNAQFERPFYGGLQIGLVFRWYFFQRHVLPLVLVAHPTTAEDGHVQFGAAEASGDHASQYKERGRDATTGSRAEESGDKYGVVDHPPRGGTIHGPEKQHQQAWHLAAAILPSVPQQAVWAKTGFFTSTRNTACARFGLDARPGAVGKFAQELPVDKPHLGEGFISFSGIPWSQSLFIFARARDRCEELGVLLPHHG